MDGDWGMEQVLRLYAARQPVPKRYLRDAAAWAVMEIDDLRARLGAFERQDRERGERR